MLVRRLLAVLGTAVLVVGVGAPAPAGAAFVAAGGGGPVVRTSPVAAVAPVPSGPVDGPLATRIRWTRWSTLVPYGVAVTLEGQVLDALGAQPDVPVVFHARPVGSTTWQRVTATTADQNGVFRVSGHRPSRTTDYRVTFAGDLLHAPSEAVQRVLVARTTSSALSLRSDGRWTFTGVVAPAAASVPVRVQRRTSAAGAWSTLITTMTSTSARWTAVVSGPSSPGTWWYRVELPGDTAYATGWSSAWSITRR